MNKSVKLHVRDFGAEPSSPNVHLALEAAVKAASKVNGPTEIIFEQNAVYRISLPNTAELKETESCFADQYAWTIKNATNLVINGQGATLLITDPEIGGICLENSSHIELKNFKIDYETLPYTQGTITKINLLEYWFELKLDPGFSEPDMPNFDRAKKSDGNWGLTIRDGEDGRTHYGPTAIFSDQWEKTGGRIWRFHPPKQGSGYSLQNSPLEASGLKSGDRYVHMARTWSQAVAGINCDHVLWEGITLYSSPGLGFYPRGTCHHTIRNCHVKIKEGRIFSTTSDGIHARGSRGHLLIEGCSFDGMPDDGINVHSSAQSVQEVPAPDQVLVKKHTFSVRPGDELLLVRSASARILGTAMVKDVEARGESWLITLNQNLPELSTGDGYGSSDNLYNLSESANPFVIRNCHFKNFRARGILVSAHGGLIENNVFEMPEGWGVVMHYESARWADGPLAYDMTIRKNKFYGKGLTEQSPIRFEITSRSGSKVETRPFHDFLIEGNQFYNHSHPIMDIHHARNMTICDNQIFCSDETVRGRAEYAAIELYDCENITIEKLTIEDRDTRQIAAVKIAPDCAQNIKVDTEKFKLDVAKTCLPVLDQRN